jgi:hypothetical protein
MPWMLFAPTLMLLLFFVCLAVVGMMDRNRGGHAVEILKERYARGEINGVEFEERRTSWRREAWIPTPVVWKRSTFRARIMRTDFIEMARNCLARSRVTRSPKVAAELRRVAEEYRKKAVDLEWENYAAGGEENVGEVVREG